MRPYLPGVMAALLLLHVGVAAAQDDDDGDEDAPSAAPADKADAKGADVRREGDYGGVVPGREGKTNGKHGRRPPKGLVVTWIGFQAKEGGAARIFVQLSGEATYDQKVVADKLVVFVAGARLGTRNHGRFIDTSFFDTSVARIEGKNVGARRGQKAGVELTVRFKKGGAKNADLKEETSADGHRYLFVDFAP
jgi:hypothetical protein